MPRTPPAVRPGPAPGPVRGAGPPLLFGTGTLEGGSTGSLELGNAAPSTLCVVFLSPTASPAPFKGGLLVPGPLLIQFQLLTGPTGSLSLPFTWPTGIGPGVELVLQLALADAAAIHGVALSNGLLGLTP